MLLTPDKATNRVPGIQCQAKGRVYAIVSEGVFITVFRMRIFLVLCKGKCCLHCVVKKNRDTHLLYVKWGVAALCVKC